MASAQTKGEQAIAEKVTKVEETKVPMRSMETYSNAQNLLPLLEWLSAELLQRRPDDPLGFLQRLVTRAVQTREQRESRHHTTLLNRTCVLYGGGSQCEGGVKILRW